MAFTLDDLDRIISERASADAKESYTRALLDAGSVRCAKKLGEEGVEAALATASGTKVELAAEAADVLYHLLVALKARDVPLSDVMELLQRRTGQSGHAEKASRINH
ncbi:phosphoribosyl-ATP diphosphatase [Hansschlegelia plantiphila]|uniref:Phosphoribosyl-ATP pyrophosphatase n=1 Tax=Hansschlegelia plantiphila TaxID=374655 RepID=A0A9W6J3E0_9HYPH|nr:phosphoribosyl-ATP diphosphatase [Hansschlegelia plantiphila]GLK68618.1 phosphoribosyl-ATP pyrophosphatase [Hansschlegelia plantiphila]